MRKLFGISLLICFVFSISTYAQEEKAEINKRATTVFTQLLKSEDDAKYLVTRIYIYSNNSPFDYNVIMTMAQRLVTNGYPHKELIALFEPCADITVALNGNDDLYAEIVLTIASLRKAEFDDVSIILYRLERLNVPAYKLLSKMTGKPVNEMKELAEKGRLRPDGVKEILLEAFNLEYNGLAAKAVKSQN